MKETREDILATKSPSSLSYTMAALNPAACALLTLSSKLQPPLVIITIDDVWFVIGTALLVSAEHASTGSATYIAPHTPVPLTDGAEIMRYR